MRISVGLHSAYRVRAGSPPRRRPGSPVRTRVDPRGLPRHAARAGARVVGHAGNRIFAQAAPAQPRAADRRVGSHVQRLQDDDVQLRSTRSPRSPGRSAARWPSISTRPFRRTIRCAVRPRRPGPDLRYLSSPDRRRRVRQRIRSRCQRCRRRAAHRCGECPDARLHQRPDPGVFLRRRHARTSPARTARRFSTRWFRCPTAGSCTGATRQNTLDRLKPTLIHEFQHMINFNQHALVRSSPGGSHLAQRRAEPFCRRAAAGTLIPNAECVGFISCRSQYTSGDLFNA